jgi:hypothetical protein
MGPAISTEIFPQILQYQSAAKWRSNDIRDPVVLHLSYVCSVHTRIQRSKLVYLTAHPLSLLINFATKNH